MAGCCPVFPKGQMSLYITTPIYYVNARPHLGHAYTTIVADTYSRFRRLCKEDVRFQTGTDEHGDKIAEAARAAGIPPKEYADRISKLFREAWPPLNIEPDTFIRTTDTHHIRTVQNILQKVHDQGDIYLGSYSGLYCRGCERFLTEKELVDGNCPDHQAAPQPISESNYFFRMSRYQEWLIDHINKNPDFITPERYKNEVLSFLSEPLEDLCISRPKSRLDWGISLPFDADFVTYVWFDALINYLSGIGYPDSEEFSHYWGVAEHIIAKDILKPHAIYWPTMLRAIGLAPFKRLHVHGYWNINEAKMSKSIGNVVRPETLCQDFGVDTVRYFLMREMSFGLDASFSDESIIARRNSDLANDLGNLFSRVISMVHKYFKGVVPQVDHQAEQELGFDLQALALKTIDEFETCMESFEFHKALIAVWEFIGQMNKIIDTTAPWVLAKKKSGRKQLEIIIYNLLEGLRIIAGLIYPVMPDTAATMQKHLGLDPDNSFYLLDRLRTWKLILPGKKLLKSVALFPRIDIEERIPESEPSSHKEHATMDIKPEITLDEFSRIDLRVATVVHAEPIPKAKKLLKLEVDMGQKRTLVAGIAEKYSPEELIGKQVIVVANLQPAKLMGVVSNGMVVAAVDDSGPVLATLEKIVVPGTPLK
jgi:methionyl-tRNA synthetase